MKPVSMPIPEISDDELAARAARIKILIGKQGEDLWAIRQENLRGNILLGEREDFTGPVEALASITMYSTASPMGHFQPSAEEVLAQIPVEYLDQTGACHLTPKLEEAPGGDYFSLEMILYKAA